MLFIGDGITINEKEAARYYKIATDDGNEEAILSYALMLKSGLEHQLAKLKVVVIYKWSIIKIVPKWILNLLYDISN